MGVSKFFWIDSVGKSMLCCYASKFKQHHLRNSNLALTPEIWGAHASNSHEWIKLIFHYILH